MSTLVKKLHAWVNAGLISQAQAEQIAKFETKDENKRSWMLYGIVSVGITAIGIGIISLVAANWGDIPPTFKMLSYLMLQSLVGVAVLKLLPRPGAAREAAIGIFALMFFAGIGLTAQIYHLQSDGWGGILFWNALSLPVILLAASRPVHYLWVILLMTAETIWIVGHLDRAHQMWDVTRRLGGVGLSLYIYFALGLMVARIPRFPPHLAEALRILSGLTIFIGGTIAANVLWYWGPANLTEISHKELPMLMDLQWVPWLGAFVLLGGVLANGVAWSRATAASFLATFFGLALLISLPLWLKLPAHPVIGTVGTILVWSIAALAAVNAGRKRLFDVITLAITVRLLVVYFEVFGSMMATGLGLILSGILVLACAWGWYKFRDHLAGLMRPNP